jgi:hypothetical protein
VLLDLLKIDPGESGGEFLVIRAIDDFLIDRVVQRISDALARWVSCYGIAAFLRREERRAQDLLPVADYVEAFLARMMRPPGA